jgi:DNA polymerase III subunit alpha
MEISDIPLDDRKTFQLLSKGETDGVFQLESRGMKEILVGMKPDCFEDIIALIALYRPGPLKSGMVQEFISRKQGKTKSTYEVPSLEPILKETYGVILYQEQVMQIASALASYTMGEADTFRKAMSKKNSSEMEKEKPKFLAGALKNKIPEAKARKIFDQMETFAGYGFNKSHSAAYAMISYQTAYLKTHYPVEFMAALLTSEKGNRDKVIKHISVCKEMGINVLPPDINQSVLDFNVDGGNIRFGLAAVKNVGESAIESIIESRDKEGSFKYFIDFCSRVDLRKINKRVVESLIKCGAFDSLHYRRRRLMENFERVMDIGQKAQDQKLSDQTNLFDGPDSGGPAGPADIEKDLLPETDEWEHGDVLANEKETLGFYITGHPLLRYSDKLKLITDADSESISEMRDKDTVTVAGIVSQKREIPTKKKDTMAYVTIEDLKGSYTGIVFADTYRNYRALIDSDEPLLFKGTLDITEESCRLIVSEIHRLTEYNGVSFSSIHVIFDTHRMDENHLGLLRDICRKYPGKHDCYLHLILPNQSETVVYLGNESKIDISQPLKEEVERLLGPGSTTLR